MKTPTENFYGLFQYIFDYYNEHLFDLKIKNCILVITRRKSVAGHYSFRRWFHLEELEQDELAINPTYMSKKPLIQLCQTIVHEMCHAWQYHYGNPSQRGYHNKEFAQKMLEVGLTPSTTGYPGGNQTGQNMSDYPTENGIFLKISEDLINSDVFKDLYLEVNPNILSQLDADKPLYDQIKDLIVNEDNINAPKPKSKIKYSCDCSNVWGKPDLNLTCNLCLKLLVPN